MLAAGHRRLGVGKGADGVKPPAGLMHRLAEQFGEAGTVFDQKQTHQARFLPVTMAQTRFSR